MRCEAVDGTAAALYLYVDAPHVVRAFGDGLHQELHEHDLLVDEGLDGRYGGIDRAVARGDGHALVVAEFQHHGRCRDERAGGDLQELECDRLLLHAVDIAHQVQQVVVVDLLFLVGQFEELVIGVVQLFLREVVAEQFEPVYERRAAAAGRQGDDRLVEPDVLRIDDLVGLAVFQYAVLVDARRVGEGIAADDRLVGLHGHVHQARHQVRGLGDELCIDIGVDGELLVAAQGHDDLFERSVAGAFADAVDRYFGLPCTVEDAAQRIGRSHAQVVVAVGRDDRLVDVGDVVDQVFYLRTVFVRQAVSRRVGDVDYRGPGRNGGLDHAGEVLRFGTPGVLGVELHVLDVAFGVLHRLDGLFEYLLGRRAQFIVNVLGRYPDPRMDAFMPGQSQGIGGDVDVFFYGAGQRTNRRGRNGLRNLEYGVEISGAGNREPCLDDVHAEAFQQLGDFDFLGGVQLAARHLLAITERGVENKKFLAHNMTNLTNLRQQIY